MRKVISLSEHCLNEVFEDVVGPEFESVAKKEKKRSQRDGDKHIQTVRDSKKNGSAKRQRERDAETDLETMIVPESVRVRDAQGNNRERASSTQTRSCSVLKNKILPNCLRRQGHCHSRNGQEGCRDPGVRAAGRGGAGRAPGRVTEALALVGDAAAPRTVQHQRGLARAVIRAHGVDAAAPLTRRLLVRALVVV